MPGLDINKPMTQANFRHCITPVGRFIPTKRWIFAAGLRRPAPASNVALVYAHRGHRCQWKTPLLQSLLAKLGPRLQAHGLRVDQAHLPFDLILLAVATLGACDRCLIVKDNAIRLGTTDVVPVNTVQYLVLSRSTGVWAVEGIFITDDVSYFSVPDGAPFP